MFAGIEEAGVFPNRDFNRGTLMVTSIIDPQRFLKHVAAAIKNDPSKNSPPV
jgi:hypothetical protein